MVNLTANQLRQLLGPTTGLDFRTDQLQGESLQFEMDGVDDDGSGQLSPLVDKDITDFDTTRDYNDEEEDSDEDFDLDYFHSPGTHGKWFPEVKEPKEEGLKLLMGGEFGRVAHQIAYREGKSNMYQSLLKSRKRVRPTPREDITAVSPPHFSQVIGVAHDNIGSLTKLKRCSCCKLQRKCLCGAVFIWYVTSQ